MKLHSIETEAKNCRKAFEGFPSDGFTLHCHHEILGEPLTEPAKNRIAYILSGKPERERALRLRLFRPITEAQLELCEGYAEYYKAYAEREKAYAEHSKARAEYYKAHAKYYKTHAEWSKAHAEYYKARTEYYKAYAEREKAYAEHSKARAEFSKEVHDKFCDKGCPWNGKTIFPVEGV